MVRVLELFAGIGACSKALTNLGIEHEIVDAVEIDKYAVQSFNAVHGTNFAPQDIKEWDKDIEADLIMHGSPCQDFSVAGKNAGGDKDSGTRSSLMYETLRIVEKLRPKYVIWENVKNLLSKKHRHNFDAYLEAMEKLGYHSQYQVLNAKDYGVPQNRERVFTVSIRNDLNVDFKFPEPQELTIRLKDVLEPQVDEKYYLSDEHVSKIKLWEDRQKENGRGFRFNTHGGDDIATTMTTSADRPSTSNYYKDPKEVRVAGKLNHYNYDKMDRIYDTDGSATTVDTMEGGGRQPKIIARTDNHQKGGVYDSNSVSPTITATTHKQPTQVAIKAGGRMLDAKTTRGSDVASTIRASIHKQGSRNLLENIKNGRGYEGVAIRTANKKGYDMATDGDAVDLSYPQSKTKRGRVGHGVSKTLMGADRMGVVEYRTKNKRIIETAEKSNFKNGETEYLDIYNKTPRKDVTSTINAGTDSHQNNIIGTNYRIRKLTPKECWRLMGFSDEDFKKAQSAGISNSQLYKQAGNSIVVNVLEGILRNLPIDQ